MAAAVLVVVLVALLAGISSDQHGTPPVPIGPGGEPITDSFSFVHQPLTGNGSITVPVSSLRSTIASGPEDPRPGTVPWAKAGLTIQATTNLDDLPITPWAGLGVLASWAAAALLAGALLLRQRDA